MMFRLPLKTVFVLSIPLLLASVSDAQDACVTLLKHGIYASHTTQTSTQTFQQFRSSFCSWYSSYRSSHTTAGVDVKIPIVDIPIGISADMTYGEADSLQKGLCSASAGTASDQSLWLEISQYIDPAGADAFKECVKALRGGLAIDAQIDDDETLAVVSVAYTPPFGAGPATLNRVDFDGWDCPKPTDGGIDMRSIVGKPGQLINNKVAIKCVRPVKPTPIDSGGLKIIADKALLSVSTTAGTYTQFFRPKVFADPIADTAKVLASYPKGTILPFAGKLEDIPAGWHICDGQLGTVNLIDRIPYGTSQLAQVGQTDGKIDHNHTYSGKTRTPDGNVNTNVKQEGGQPLSVFGTDHTHSYSGTTTTVSNLPPVTRVIFIQKIQ